MNDVISSFSNFVLTHRNKFLFAGCSSALGYFLYKKYLSDKAEIIYELYKQYKELTSLTNDSNTSESKSALVKFEKIFDNLLIKLLEEIKLRTENKYPCEKIWSRIEEKKKESNNQNEIAKLWNDFKDTNFHSYINSAIITRITIYISQVFLLVLEKLNIDNDKKLPSDVVNTILGDVWNLTINFIDVLINYLHNKTESTIQKIGIRDQYNFEKFCLFLEEVKNKSICCSKNEYNEIKIEIIQEFSNSILKKIEKLEEEKFQNSLNTCYTDIYISYYSVLYDLVDSNVFNIVLLKTIDHDFSTFKDILKLNYDNISESISIPKITNFISKIRKQLLHIDNSIFVFKNLKNENVKSDLEELFKVIFDS